MLLSNLLFHHGEDLFLELYTLLLVKLQEKIFQLFLMFIIDEAFDSGGNLFGSQVELHLGNEFIQCLSSHIVLLGLEIVRVLQCFLDSLSQLTLLLLALILNGFVAAGSSRSEFVLQGLVLVFRLLSKLLTDILVDLVELCQ